MEREVLYENYLKSLEQKYNAVCFDIDGTLTVNGSKRVDEQAKKMIVDILKRKVPVVFITGRGESGLNDLKDDIYEYLINSENINENDLKRLYVLTNDGARLFSSKDTSSYFNFLNETQYVLTKDELSYLLEIENEIKNNDEYKDLTKYFEIKHSDDKKNKITINIRLLLNTNDESIINDLYDKINILLSTTKYRKFHVTRGVYESIPVLQIGMATKDIAIERTERIIGVPKDSMIRIGDCGDIKGNDYAMLNCKQGYSVDKISGANDSCFPVFDKQGNIIKGVEATIKLVETAKILPTVCLEKANKDIYKHEFANIEKGIVKGRKRLLNEYNDIINNNFDENNGLDSLFDRHSGSVKIPMFEWELLEDNALKDLWSTTIDQKQIYSIKDNSNYLLRGSRTYYYFISNRRSINGKDITTKNNVLEWYENYIKFFENSFDAIALTKDLSSITNKKLVIGILDNCRNALLVVLNHYLVTHQYGKNVLLDVTSDNDCIINKVYNALLNVDKMMSKMCFDMTVFVNKEDALRNIECTKLVMMKSYIDELEKEEKEDYSKEYRAYREIDNFGENYVAVSLYNDKSNDNKLVNACGLSYGGIELPILAKIIRQEKIEKILLLKFNKKVSGYTNKQLIELREFNINDSEYGGLMNSEKFSGSSVDLFDDNILTGKTLQLAINSLYDCGINTNNTCIVRYPSINRIDQMFMGGTTAVDYHLFFENIYGLCFESPYSWKDDSWEEKNGRIDYTDSLGIFDINREKIVNCLIKNHDYLDDSEVAEQKRRIKK